ncbi:MAG: L,D-transpeptidase family protein [Firmicutes bacterium]|nr:L,D-transpeptidase family protein [Bacillota bacterium]
MKKPKYQWITAFLILILSLAVLCGCGGTGDASSDPEGDFDITAAEDSPDFVGQLEQAKDANQLFIVAGVGETTAYVSMHQKDEDGSWKQILTTPAVIGKFGLGKTKEGDGKTPTGTYHFNYAFGIEPDPGCTAFAYQQVTEDDYWSGDQREGYRYNEMVSIKDLPDLNTDDSEHIVEYPVHYRYCMNISYNEEGEAGKGSAIFLHCLAPQKPYTGGCVALPEDKVITALQNVEKDCVVVIDSLENLSPDLWEEWDPAGDYAAKEAAEEKTAEEKTAGMDLSAGITRTDNEKTGESTVESDVFRLTLPKGASWDYEVDSPTEITFYNKAAKEGGFGGTLFTLRAYEPNDTSYDPVPNAVVGEKDGKKIVAVFTSDVQYDVENEAASGEYMDVFSAAQKISDDAAASPLVLK